MRSVEQSRPNTIKSERRFYVLAPKLSIHGSRCSDERPYATIKANAARRTPILGCPEKRSGGDFLIGPSMRMHGFPKPCRFWNGPSPRCCSADVSLWLIREARKVQSPGATGRGLLRDASGIENCSMLKINNIIAMATSESYSWRDHSIFGQALTLH